MKSDPSRQKAIISFSSCSNHRFRNRNSQDLHGNFPQEQLAAKGQLFVVANCRNGHSESSKIIDVVLNLINEVYYSDPSSDVITSLEHAFQDTNALVYEMFNANQTSSRIGINCTALVLTKDQVYITQIGDILALHITAGKIERLASTNNTKASPRQRERITFNSRKSPEASPQNRALGLDFNLEVERNQIIPLKVGDCYLLSTDSLVNVSHQEIRNIVMSNSPEQASRKLIHFTKESVQKHGSNVQVIKIDSTPNHSVTPLLRIKTALSNKNIWYITVLLFLLLVIADYNLIVESQNKSDPTTTQIQPQKEVNQTPPVISAELNLPAIEKTVGPETDIQSNKSQSEVSQKKINVSAKKTNKATTNTKSVEFIHTISQKPATKQMSSLKPSDSDRLGLFKNMSIKEWKYLNLTEDDYEVNASAIIFLNSTRIKKAMHRTEFSDLSFQVDAQVLKGGTTGRYGIIIGYQSTIASPYETYYLFCVNKQRQILLQKYSNFRKEILATIPFSIDSTVGGSYKIQLKVMSHGPYLELYANQKRLFVWQAESNIKGRIGFYVDPYIQVAFSKFKTSNSTFLKQMTSRQKPR